MSTLTPKRFRWDIVYPPPGPKWFICPKTWYRIKRTAYRCRVSVTTSHVQVKEKSPEKIPEVESEEDLEEEEGLDEASESDLNTLPLDYTTSDEDTNSDLVSYFPGDISIELKDDLPEPELLMTRLHGIIPQIVTQVTNNVNNANTNGGNRNDGNGNGGNGGNNNGCTYKEFLACKPRALMEKKARGREAAMRMTWEKFKALLVEEFCPSNKMEKLESEALTDEAVRCGTLSKISEKRKEVEEPSKQRGMWTNNKRAKVGKGFVAVGPTRNKNNGNQTRGKAFNGNAIEARQDPNVVTGTFSLNDHFATVLFDSGANFSFISTKFVPLLNVTPSIIRLDYMIEVANGTKVETDRIIRGYKLELGDSLFTIDLIPFGHGSFDVIVRMNWLSRHKAEIV
ncbi:putative reverse transcriptase domain-containing protein [Tanacetum coccineum]